MAGLTAAGEVIPVIPTRLALDPLLRASVPRRAEAAGTGTGITGFAEATRAPGVRWEYEGAGRTVLGTEPRANPRSDRGDST
ncbi:MAG: hypothetical protein O3A42_12145, partial [Actinobacteria bacterium]|nr:hypothetical protein [Actinomycetota bacterium]